MNKRQIKKYIKKVNQLIKDRVPMEVIYQTCGNRDDNGIPHHFETRRVPLVKYHKL